MSNKSELPEREGGELPDETPPVDVETGNEDDEGEERTPSALDAHESHFVVPFLSVPSADGLRSPGPNPELLDKYLAHLRTLIDARTVAALQDGADVGVKVSFLIEFE